MKKITLALLVMLAFCWQSNAQVTVGDGTYSSAFNTYPINPYYGYSYAQSIYLASEINASGDITSISFEMANADVIDNSDDLIDLWIGHTTKTEFDTATDWADVTTLTQVMTSGTLTKTGTTITFTFSAPFTYNGTDNLIIALDANEDGFEASSDVLIGTDVGSNRTLRQMSDSVNADPTAPPTGVLTSYIGNTTFNGITQTCPNPSALTATNIAATQADLGWTAGSSESLWNIELGVAGFSPTGTPTASGVANPYTAMSLTSATDYEYYVQADCTGGDVSGWVGPYAFTTACVAFTPEYNADMSTNVPNCWEEAGDGDIASGPSDLGSGLWYASNHNGTASNAINLYTDNRSDWIISPEIDLSSAAASELKIYVALTENGTNGSGADLGSDDRIDLLMTTDSGANWTSMQTWTQGNVPTDIGEEITYDLSAITGTVQFAFYGSDGPVNDTEDIYFHVSKFQVRETPSCSEPTGLTATVTGLDTVDFSWTAGGSETDWTYEYGVSPYAQGGGGTSGTVMTTPSLSLSSLTPGETYDIYVQADCGGSESAYVTVSWTQPNVGDTCTAPIMVNSLPYNTSDDTASYGDDYSGSPGATSCGTTNNYLNGDDVVYAYTAGSDGSINIAMSSIGSTYSGVFVYTDCADIGTECVAGYGNGSSTADYDIDVPVLNGTTYYVVISTWATPQSTTYTLDITENTCTEATVTYSVVDDCANSGGFNIEVDITDMGSATDLTVSDDQGSATQAATGVTTLTFGPYVNATDVIITVADDNDGTCTQSSTTLTQGACPPSNDICSNAEALTIGSTVAGSTAGATGASSTSCDGSIGNDVWYTVIGDGGDLTVTVDAADEDQQIGIFESVDCAGITLGSCDYSEDGFSNPDPVTFPTTNGTKYYIQVGAWISSGNPTSFTINVSSTLSTNDFDNEAAFTYYPNPVKNTLNLNAQNTIEQVAMYNMLGQEVLRATPNAIDSELDMSNLQTGTYFVKVTIANITKTIRVIKQ